MGKEYKVTNDGYGFLVASYPDVYPEAYLEENVTDTTLEKKIEALLSALTLDEKIELLSADGVMGHDTSAMDIEKSYGNGYWAGAPRVGIPVIRCYDGPMGIRGTSGTETTRPSSEISLACTFDRALAAKYGTLYAIDNKASAGNMQLGIQTDLVRTVSTNRARDMFGEDWFLEAQIASAMSAAVEKNHVLACLKHCGGLGNIDEQSMMENQISVYETILRRHNTVHTVMTNYGSTNGIQACADSYVLQKVIREMWKWKGIILTDWGGNYQFTVDKGVTIETPSNTYNNRENVLAALEAGKITEADIDYAVWHNLYALGKIGYLGLVQISRDGTAATDFAPPESIELPECTDLAERVKLLEINHAAALEVSQAGIVLLKNRANALPLGTSGHIAMIGLGAEHLVAGHMHECSFGWLRGLAVSPGDAMTKLRDDVKVYPALDELGTPVPETQFFLHETGTDSGLNRVGHDGSGAPVSCVDKKLDFVTNSTDYLNGPTGNAFPYETQGAAFTWTTWLEAPESGSYLLKVEAMGAVELSASITIDGVSNPIGSAGGDIGGGFWGNTGIVTTKTGMDVPKKFEPMMSPFGNFPFPENMAIPNYLKQTGEVNFQLERGKRYQITVNVDGSIPERYDYERGKKDLQIRLAWVTPSQEKENYQAAVEAAAKPNTTAIVFAHELDKLDLAQEQAQLLDDVIHAAKQAGNKVVLVLHTGVPVNITKWEPQCDAILAAWLPGQAGGEAVANVLCGKHNPTGKLCVTWPRNFDADQTSWNVEGREVQIKASHPGSNESREIREGIFTGYKWFDAMNRTNDVLFPFGHGLSYTTFQQSVSNVIPSVVGSDSYGFDVTVSVTNTGLVAGEQVVQLYLKAPEADSVPGAILSPEGVNSTFRYVDENGIPTNDHKIAAYFPKIDGIQFVPKQLCGFGKTKMLEPGETDTVTIHVDQRSLSYWNSEQESYTKRPDGTMDKWVVVLGERVLLLCQNSFSVIEEAPVLVAESDSGNELFISCAPEVISGMEFSITVSGGDSLVGVKLIDSEDNALPITDLKITRDSNSSCWELHSVLVKSGTYQYQIVTKNLSGWQKTSKFISFSVKEIAPKLVSVEPDSEIVHAGDSIVLIASVNSPVKRIEVRDEAGVEIESQLKPLAMQDSLMRFALEFPAKETEIGKIFQCTAYNESGIESNTVKTAASILAAKAAD